MHKAIVVGIAISILGWSSAGWTWDPNEVEKLTPKVAEAVAAMKTKDPGIESFFEKATGYVVFPTVGKGGFGIGGARGKGLLMVGGETVAVVTLTQVTFGFQAGAQAYSEFIFFEDDLALANFRRGNYELDAQASAVAITAGASVDAKFNAGDVPNSIDNITKAAQRLAFIGKRRIDAIIGCFPKLGLRLIVVTGV